MRIGVFVGSFDPVHMGHTAIMNYLVNEKIVDKVLVIPTGNYWEKQNLTALKKRLDMLDLIKTDKIMIDKEYNHCEYTYQILDGLEKENRVDEYYLVMGVDNFEKICLWKNYLDILKRGVIVIRRGIKKIVSGNERIIFVNKDFGEVSSTMIREKIHDGKYLEIDGFLDKKVLEYIIEMNLYK